MKSCTDRGTKQTRHKLSCELAYTGTLFWLPLLIWYAPN